MWKFCEVKMLHKRQPICLIFVIILGHDIPLGQNAHFFVIFQIISSVREYNSIFLQGIN